MTKIQLKFKHIRVSLYMDVGLDLQKIVLNAPSFIMYGCWSRLTIIVLNALHGNIVKFIHVGHPFKRMVHLILYFKKDSFSISANKLISNLYSRS